MSEPRSSDQTTTLSELRLILKEFVDDDTPVDIDPGSFKETYVWMNTNGQPDELAIDRFPAFCPYRTNASVIVAQDFFQFCRQTEIYPMFLDMPVDHG